MQNIIVVGATGIVGKEILALLLEHGISHDNIFAAASKRSSGSSIAYGDFQIVVKNVSDVDFRKMNIAFFTAGAEVSRDYAQKAASLGCVVIDNTSCFRMSTDVPLIIPEINFSELQNLQKCSKIKIISNPNCATIPMLMALKPLHDAFGLQEIVASTYQSVSGVGRVGISELLEQTQDCLNDIKINPLVFSNQIAFNVIQQIDDILENGYTKEEEKIINETRKILGINSLAVTATCVRVPVVRGHAVSVFAKFHNNVDYTQACQLLSDFPGVEFYDDSAQITTLVDSVLKNNVFVNRLRKHRDFSNAISFWCFCDNIKKGAALNAVQIAKQIFKF